MKSKIIAVALFILTVATVIAYPSLRSNGAIPRPRPPQAHLLPENRPKIEVVFALDTTGSMGGLIQTAKEKIWSIATTMASAQQAPEIRIGLVAYRDHGDAYITKVVDLSDDLDSVYATLMDFQADGGGDTPESVNKALYDAVHNMSWSEPDDAYQVVFLVGDAPPHMDYNEVRYPEIVASAHQKGIVINTIQCGEIASAIEPWTQIASLGHGNFFQVEQAGGAVAYDTPFDEEIATLSAKIDDTRLYYGTEEEKDRMLEKVAATDKLHAGASFASRARRGVFNASKSGKTNLLGSNELVDAVASGAVDLDEIKPDALPEALVAMAPEKRKEHIEEIVVEREDLKRQIQKLSEDRDGYLAKKVEEAGGLRSSLDQQLYEAVKEQASAVGLEYEKGPAY